MEQQSTLRHQNFMLAIRREMGLPVFKPANDCLYFGWGRPMDFEVGSEMARLCEQTRRDGIYAGWTSIAGTDPTDFTVIFREMVSVDVIDGVVPYAAGDDAPLVFVNMRAEELFALDRRGSLMRVRGMPKNALRDGRGLAMKRIKATAASFDDTMLESNRHMLVGGECEHEASLETIVRFG